MENETGKIEEKRKLKKPAKKKAAGKIDRPSKKESAPLASLAIAVVATSLIVGSGIYIWQKQSVKSDIGKVSEEARVARLEFENRLSSVKDKLSGAESENEALKAKNEELASQASLLSEAKIEYKNPELGISFSYPAIFGQVEIKEIEGKSGKMFRGQFRNNDNLVFGGVTQDFTRNSEITKAVFLDTLGYKNEKNNFYFLPMADSPESDYRMIPMKVIKGNVEALLISKESFPANDAGAKAVEFGEEAGLLINIGDKGAYPAVAFLNSDLSALSLEKMEEIGKSFRVE
jgi:hypothetical protein